jgi:hypothetical protein
MRDVPEHLRKNLKKCIIMIKKGAIKEEEETSDMEESDEEKDDKEKGVKEEGVKEGAEGVDEDIRNGWNHQEDYSLLTMSIQPPPLPPNYEEFFPSLNLHWISNYQARRRDGRRGGVGVRPCI